jgi:hypothetical protein
MSKQRLRVAWIIPNIFMYLLFVVVFSGFVIINANGLREINRLSIWIFVLILLFFIALFGTYRIWVWIKQGKL